jgi:hypothetical protein
MTAIAWDAVGQRRYQSGIDRGVLYLQDGRAVPWNGLTQITENVSSEVKSYYLDGIKYLDKHIPGSYSAKLQAITYPDELDDLTGNREFSPGVFLHDQSHKLFNLSYRTLIGNDLQGTDYGYKIHIVWNVLATQSDFTYKSLSDSMGVDPFEWDLNATPNLMFGIRPTAHISLDSRRMSPGDLTTLELMLYGSALFNPQLPGIVDLLGLIENMEGAVIVGGDGEV